MGHQGLKFTEKELDRYSRQMIIPRWGEEGQRRLKKAKVFVAGAGGLGSPLSIYLAVAGVGKIRICDNGIPELSNLNRQILHCECDIGKNKAYSAKDTLFEINPNVDIEPIVETINEDNAQQLIGDSDLIIDCLDDFQTRHILNKVAVNKQIPFIHAGVYGLTGQLTFIHPPETPCLYCIFPGSFSRSGIFPILGATAGIIGCLEALEAIKWIVGIGNNLKGRLLIFNGEEMEFQMVEIKKDPNCPICSRP